MRITKEPEVRKQEILDTALKLFGEKGYEKTSIADIAKAICDKLGYELKIEDMEFDAIIAAVSSGKADFGAAGITVTEDRKKNIDFTDTYTKACQVIVVRNK